MDGEQKMWVRIVVAVMLAILGIATGITAHYITLNQDKTEVATACIKSGGQWKMNQLREYECVR